MGFYPILSRANLSIPLQVNIYNLGIGSDYQVVRMGIHPSWKWGSLHLGHSNLRFSSFTQNGRTLFGAGVQINPGLFRFGALWGSSRQTGTSILSNTVESNAYPQEVFTVKVGLGNRNHFLDLIYLKGKDDGAEVDTAVLQLDQYPEENAVLALRTEQYFFKRKWFFGGEFALSGLTSNQNSRSLQEVSDEIPDIPEWLLEPKVATLVANAAEAFVGYRGRLFNTKVIYQRISPGFRSFGAYYFQDDIESIDIAMGVKLMKSKLRVKVRGGVRQDNLANDQSLRTTRARGFLQLYYKPNRNWLFTANYSNYQTEQRLQDFTNRDSLRTAIVSNNINANAQRTIQDKSKRRHTIRLSGGIQTSMDRYEQALGPSQTKNYSAGLNYRMYSAANLWQLGFGLDYLGFEQTRVANHRYGNRLEISRNLAQGKWRVGLNSNQVIGYAGSTLNTVSFIPGALVSYRPSLADFINLRLSYSDQSFRNTTSSGFSELQIFLRYTRRLGVKKKA